MTITGHAVEWIARRLKVPPLAVRFFRTANALSGIDRRTLPTELVPLNSIMISRGLLNFTLLQTLRGWVLPYWAEEQYNPESNAFVPRSHLGLSMNITHRNWTGIGHPECGVEPIVDPRGLVTPFRDGWSIDVWLVVDHAVMFPSRTSGVTQRLVGGVPVIETTFDFREIRCILTAHVDGSTLVQQMAVHNSSAIVKECRVAVAIRPFNPEGVALIHSLRFDVQSNTMQVEAIRGVVFSAPPSVVVCFSQSRGDSASAVDRRTDDPQEHHATCDTGLANGFAGFDFTLDSGQGGSFEARLALGNDAHTQSSTDAPLRFWASVLAGGANVTTPDARLNEVLLASLSTLVMLTDGDSVTPGPATYHQFWFRDAAYMLCALDRFGLSRFTKPVISSYPRRQEGSGFFRSQQGEWDSNGQAIWTAWQHSLYSHDQTLLRELLPSLRRGARWILQSRTPNHQSDGDSVLGLLPAGLSAEHLGVSDHYFWDNFWSAAGLRAFLRLCDLTGNSKDRDFFTRELSEYEEAIENAVARAQKQHGIREIPASPRRTVDNGMIGSCCAWYPLQYYSPDDLRMATTLETLSRMFVRNGMFFQEFIHSGLNAYLTLHVAHAWLYAGNRRAFWDLLQSVICRSSPTGNFPEAIHPLTGGGCMGDGHHGWAAAEVALAVRDAFVQEFWKPGKPNHDLVLLGGIPAAWFYRNEEFAIAGTPIPEGHLDVRVQSSPHDAAVRITFRPIDRPPVGKWYLRLPMRISDWSSVPGEVVGISEVGGETLVEIRPGSALLRIPLAEETMVAGRSQS